VPSYVNKENSSIFKDFVNKANLVEKPEETIRGTLSYHYEVVIVVVCVYVDLNKVLAKPFGV
jgi:hypothetical protein